MSRIGKQFIEIPKGVDAKINGLEVSVKGPKGNVSTTLHPHVKVSTEDKNLVVEVDNPRIKFDKSLWGLYRSIIASMVEGVTKGFEKKLEISGVGFRASVSGNKLVLNIGYSHPIELEIPEGVSAEVEKNIITVSGPDKQMVGQFAAKVKAQRPPEPYKGKGIKYAGEAIRRKAGKAAKALAE